MPTSQLPCVRLTHAVYAHTALDVSWLDSLSHALVQLTPPAATRSRVAMPVMQYGILPYYQPPVGMGGSIEGECDEIGAFPFEEAEAVDRITGGGAAFCRAHEDGRKS